ncbi:sodium/nucleoside cotransporter [Plakobranchus ocellatus]|uniref:Sodium/nucleoside cotransporter n=1 Tax=Plakobranchus ocellatus TaxID=259542 RepID=A0AAV4AD74_9GAST|nr:sodium/nucleoside cotransporter [Plakobranchus ocellatus]
MSSHNGDSSRGTYHVNYPNDALAQVANREQDMQVEMSNMGEPKLVSMRHSGHAHPIHDKNGTLVDGFEQVNMHDNKKGFSDEEDTKKDEDEELSEFELELDDHEDKERAWQEANFIERGILLLQHGCRKTHRFLKKITKGHFFLIVFLVCFSVYFILAMNYRFGDEGSHRLLGCTIVGICIWVFPYLKRFVLSMFKKLYGSDHLTDGHAEKWTKAKTIIRWIMYFVMTAIMVYVCVDEGRKKPRNMRSLPGIAIFLLIALLCSSRPSKVHWHTIFWSIALQFICAVFVLKWKFGKNSIVWIQDRFTEFFDNTDEGSKLAFGDTYKDHMMIFGAVPLILYTNAVFTILYYLGVMQYIIRFIGNILRFFLGVSPIEAMSVSAGIFLEGLASTMMMRPFLAKLTKSEMFTVMTGCMSSLGGGYLGILAAFGVSLEYLIPAMLISAPATFAICKIMVPEVREPDEDNSAVADQLGAEEKSKYLNIFDAAQTGALSMLPVIANVIVVAYSFFSAVTWINHTLGWFGDRVGVDDLSIEVIASYILYPVAYAMGVEPEDCRRVAMLMGYRIGVYNVIAFLKLTEMKYNKAFYDQYMLATNFTGTITKHREDITLDGWNKTLNNGFISDRSEAIITYCLCGFSSALSAALLMGLIFILVPKRKKWVNNAAIPAILAGNLANCMTGCFASLFY